MIEVQSSRGLLRGGCEASPWLRPVSPSGLPKDFPARGCEQGEGIRTALWRGGQAEGQLLQERPLGLAPALGFQGKFQKESVIECDLSISLSGRLVPGRGRGGTKGGVRKRRVWLHC